MKIGVDMDSVLAEIIPSLDAFHNEVYRTSISIKDHIIYSLNSLWECSDEEVTRRVYEFYQSSHFDKITPVKGSQKSIKTLSQKHTLTLISSRPYFIEYKSHAWLNTYFKDTFSKVVHTNQVAHKHETRKKKSEICIQEGIKVMIEDHIDYAIDCANAGIEVLLLPATWNKKIHINHPKIKKVKDWDTITEYLCT